MECDSDNGERLTVRIAGIIPHSFVDGPGVRFVLFFQGCPHNCDGCHNPETHDINGGTEITVAEIIERIRNTKCLDGVTLSGGDPLLQPEAVCAIADAAHSLGLSVWCYTGWMIEGIPLEAREVLNHIDVLIDGKFDKSLKSDDCIYRGSTNQRIIDVRKWRNNG